ncbi:hypothetical protein I6F09_33525 [Bradyrhizobium sp. IC3195]|uniref:hypothetical protein n=1 Tax=Bradyrhizobium sp. IC3195 TaxID=2793804 RepID=UPI001CD4204F|nr:hypothetical protein [Bradyrhizobium sp. IC3195]MCA1472774.1 hypothetical protein [Bradyrhizobium sp. IC3195]
MTGTTHKEQRASPSDCILLLALPRSFDAIQSALGGGPYADYVSRGLLWGNVLELWESTFKGVASAANALAVEARNIGISVTEDATLADLHASFEGFRIITIVAHWRGPTLSKEDIALPPSLIANRLCEDQDEFSALFRIGMAPDWTTRLATSGSEDIRRSRLAELLNTRLSRPPPLAPSPQATQWHMDFTTLYHFNRAALDHWWPDAIRAGNRLELFDGLHSAEDIGGTVPNSWAGVADLSNCQSAQLISIVKCYRHDRVVIANELETDPVSRMAALQGVYRLVAQGWDYVEARRRLAELIRSNGRGGEKS